MIFCKCLASENILSINQNCRKYNFSDTKVCLRHTVAGDWSTSNLAVQDSDLTMEPYYLILADGVQYHLQLVTMIKLTRVWLVIECTGSMFL